MLILKDISLSFAKRKGQKVFAVKNISFQINQGETLALVGESGSGKSTLAKILMGIHQPEIGHISTDLKPTDKQYIFQDPHSSLNPRMKVGHIIGEPMMIARSYSKERVLELLSLVGLTKLSFDKYPHAFSGGERQRIAIARSLSLNPRLLILDEPTSALDVSIQAQILELLETLQKRLGLTYLFISHDLAVVKRLAMRVAVMYLGEIVEIRETTELFSSPKHPYTEALLDSIPRFGEKCLVKIRGEAPRFHTAPSGCPFAPRCPKAMDICESSHPKLKSLIRCHLYD